MELADVTDGDMLEIRVRGIQEKIRFFRHMRARDKEGDRVSGRVPLVAVRLKPRGT